MAVLVNVHGKNKVAVPADRRPAQAVMPRVPGLIQLLQISPQHPGSHDMLLGICSLSGDGQAECLCLNRAGSEPVGIILLDELQILVGVDEGNPVFPFPFRFRRLPEDLFPAQGQGSHEPVDRSPGFDDFLFCHGVQGFLLDVIGAQDSQNHAETVTACVQLAGIAFVLENEDDLIEGHLFIPEKTVRQGS